MDKDTFIFNYLEGNLNVSQKQLFEEMMKTDKSFEDEVEAWRKSYFLKNNTHPISMPNKHTLFPFWYKKGGLVLGTTIGLVSLLLMFRYFNNKNEILHTQLNNLEMKQLHQFYEINSSKKENYLIEKASANKHLSLSKKADANCLLTSNDSSEKSIYLPFLEIENDKLSFDKEKEVITVYKSVLSETKLSDENVGKENYFQTQKTKSHVKNIFNIKKALENPNKNSVVEDPKIENFEDFKNAFKEQTVIPMD